MTRLFGIAGVQMDVVAWNPGATIDKIAQVIKHIGHSFPWVQMIIFHKLCSSAMVQFDSTPDLEYWNQVRQPIPGPQTDRLGNIAHRAKKWLVPGSM